MDPVVSLFSVLGALALGAIFQAAGRRSLICAISPGVGSAAAKQAMPDSAEMRALPAEAGVMRRFWLALAAQLSNLKTLIVISGRVLGLRLIFGAAVLACADHGDRP